MRTEVRAAIAVVMASPAPTGKRLRLVYTEGGTELRQVDGGPRSAIKGHADRRIIRSMRVGGILHELHATKGWRHYRRAA